MNMKEIIKMCADTTASSNFEFDVDWSDFDNGGSSTKVSPSSMPLHEIKEANRDREFCIACGTRTKIGLSERYCPRNCDLKK